MSPDSPSAGCFSFLKGLPRYLTGQTFSVKSVA